MEMFDSPKKAGQTCTAAGEPSQWPLHIYTLGRFSLVLDGVSLRSTGKSPGKPLLLLKALLALGGRQVSTRRLAAMLWPEQEGDRARQSFDTTLHRLRRHIQDDGFLLVEDGHLSLDNQRVWVDVWEFERRMSSLRSALRIQSTQQSEKIIASCGTRLLHLYQGHFLQRDEPECWMISQQERLRSKYIHTLLQLGRYLERAGQHEQAVECYLKGIDVDNLIESFYQRLIICYTSMGRDSDAIAAYRQCRHLLSVVLGLQPTAETYRLYQQILANQQRLIAV